ncbi:MAG: branched-chain amino acid ABC transporter permease [Chloroflexi bacterium]|nr:branched-chain amino acid ABC transporter permease [Chloroflexota bacterium]
MAVETQTAPRGLRRRRIRPYQVVQIVVAVSITAFLLYRLQYVLFVDDLYGLDTWTRFLISGLVIGAVYAVIAIGYTLVYGILFMINFAHGEVMMLGAFAAYFVFEALGAIPAGAETSFLNTYPIISIILAFIAGMSVSTGMGLLLERVAYRPLRGGPRLVALISAIGASLFLQNAAQLMFSPRRRAFANPDFLSRGAGFEVMISGRPVLITYTGTFVFVGSLLLLALLYFIIQRTRFGQAVRAIAEDQEAAALMGINVDRVIAQTFALSGAMAGAAGVMWGLHNGIVYHFIGFLPGLKAFTAAVLGGIGNIPGAMVGGLVLGVVEALGPAFLGLDFQLKDVIAFSILVLVLVFRPSGILGEVVAEEKV